MEELTETKLARPMDRGSMGNDVATLRALCGELNNPILTGAVVELKEEIPEDRSIRDAAHAQAAIMQATMSAPVEELPMPIRPAKTSAILPPPYQPPVPDITIKMPRPSRIFFTGAGRVGKSWLAAQLGARVMELDDPIRATVAETFGDIQEASYVPFAHEVFAWGEGIVNTKYPLTGARAAFVRLMRTGDSPRFGTAGFWSASLIERVTAFQAEYPGELVVVTDVGTVDQYKALKGAGFTPFHVMCNAVTRQARGGSQVVPNIITQIEQDIVKKVSQQPRGPKLWCIWNDTNYGSTSPRFITSDEFLKGMKV